MAHIRDVRRLSGTAFTSVGVLVLWFLFLKLQLAGSFEWFLPENALNAVSMDGWTIIIVAFLALTGFVSALLIYAIPVDKESGSAIGALRQLQCQHCRAVFRVSDNGVRPLTHSCPSCKAYGVYEPSLGPVGEPPVPEAVVSLKHLELTCKSCQHKFQTVDTGARPLRVECPSCDALGVIR